MDRAAQSDALAQASRARLFRALSELQRPAGTAELAELLGLHPNGVRAHLERLADAGLVVREREHRPRGRPRDSWSIDPAVGPGADPPRAYADLSRWLLRGLVARNGVSRKAVEATGREVGQELAGDGEAGAPEERMHRALATLGFRPERSVKGDGKLNYTLANCPYREAVRENQPVVCALHRGLTRGLLDGISPSSQLTAFVPHDPDVAGCLIQVEGPLADEVAERSAAASASRRPTP
jgi:predicted ArsR family transcriptional regulator